MEEAIQLFYAGDDTGGGGIQANAPAEVAWKEPAESSELGPRSDLSTLLSSIYAHFFVYIFLVNFNLMLITFLFNNFLIASVKVMIM